MRVTRSHRAHPRSKCPYTGRSPRAQAFAATPAARKRRYDPGRFSFNVAKGRCETCEGEGSLFVELLFMPSVYAPCPTCHGARYNAATLQIELQGRNIAQVLGMTVEQAAVFFADDAAIARPLQVLMEVGLGYLRLGQPATELSGGEAQRIKLASELQRAQRRDTVYLLDEPTTGLHPADVDRRWQCMGWSMRQHGDRGADMRWPRQRTGCSTGQGAGAGRAVVVAGPPARVAKARASRTAGLAEGIGIGRHSRSICLHEPPHRGEYCVSAVRTRGSTIPIDQGENHAITQPSLPASSTQSLRRHAHRCSGARTGKKP